MAENDRQRAILAILPKISASFSMTGSVWIITEVVTHPLKPKQVYHRVLLAMSVYDILESIWNFASTWPIPESTPGIHHPRGNTKTCTTQGFFLQLGLAIPIYNAWLSVYYYLLIGRGMSEEQIRASRWEITIHVSSFVIAFGTAFAAVLLDLYNNANLWCWIAPLPAGCDTNSSIDCERGNHAWIYRWAFYFGPLWTCIVVAVLFVVAVYLKVRSLEVGKKEKVDKQSSSKVVSFNIIHPQDDGTVTNGSIKPDDQQNVRSGYFNDEDDDEVDSDYRDDEQQYETPSAEQISPTPDEGQRQQEHSCLRRRTRGNTRQVLSQCLWYLAAFYMTHLFSTVNRIIQLAHGKTYFPLLVFHSFVDPLQGFLNFLVYRRPIYMRYRRFFPELPRYECWYKAFRWHFTYDSERERTEVLIQRQKIRRERFRQQQAEFEFIAKNPLPKKSNDSNKSNQVTPIAEEQQQSEN